VLVATANLLRSLVNGNRSRGVLESQGTGNPPLTLTWAAWLADNPSITN
jgi:hypothetical protein